jgi:uncharacterized flavoprotein (TIGR03862 family)
LSLSNIQSPQVAIIGGGPAGLMAAEVIAEAGYSVSLYDAMPSVGRKFLLAGVGGMNITHSELAQKFLTRYGQAAPALKPYLERFSPDQLRSWIHGLGIDTFVGSSGRVFPTDMKAAPLLRAWLHRLRSLGVQIHPRHRWHGWCGENQLLVEDNKGAISEKFIAPQVTLLALGGASWQRLGSDGAWVDMLREKNIAVANLQPSNCGFDITWSDHLKGEFSGAPLQTICLSVTDLYGQRHFVRGEAMIAGTGIEGTSVYALSSVLRELIAERGSAELVMDLMPDSSLEKLNGLLAKPRGKNSMSNFLRKQLNLPPVKFALLRELTSADVWQDHFLLAQAIKHLPLQLNACRPIDEAISSAGGVLFDELDNHLMLKKFPGVFCAGEMLDWEAPTGGYLLTACFATGRAAGEGVVNYLRSRQA